MTWWWVVVAVVAWWVLAIPTGMLIGRLLRARDRQVPGCHR